LDELEEDVVTQAELKEVVELRALKRRCERICHSLRERLNNGAIVEPGELTAQVKRCQSRQFTQRILREVLGEDGFAELTARVPARKQARLIIEPR
jgi:hypothetical protein